MAIYIVKALKAYLKSPLSAAASTVILRELLDSKGDALALADFGAWGVIVIKQGDVQEMIKFDGLAVAADGTVTLTVATSGRHLDPTQPYAGGSTGLAFQSGAEAIITNDPLTMSQYINKNNDETMAGYLSVPTPVSAAHAVTKAYVDAIALGGATTVDRLIVAATAGETVAAGNLLYFDLTDNEWKKTDADTAATLDSVMLGIAQGAGTNGNAISGGVLLMGVDTNQSGMTQGDLMYAGNTAGAIASSAGTNLRVIGIARSATNLFFNPYFNGAASAANIQNSSYVYAADSVGTDAYAITVSPTPSTYAAGQTFSFKAGTANTGAATLAVNGGAAKAIKKNLDVDLETGDIQANQLVIVMYDGTNFQLLSRGSAKNPIVTVYTAGNTWTKAAGLKYVEVEVQAGGGGGGGSTTAYAGGAGGGGGGYSRRIIGAASLGATETVTVGAGGLAGTGGGGTGGTGGSSSFGSLATTVGGTGGGGGSGSASVVGGVGGTAASGDMNVVGGKGGFGISGLATAELAIGGSGGNAHLGSGAGATMTAGGTDYTGVTGAVYGGGGSGGACGSGGNDTAGGAGGAGVVIVKEYY